MTIDQLEQVFKFLRRSVFFFLIIIMILWYYKYQRAMYNKRNFEKISIGMTKSQMIDIMGNLSGANKDKYVFPIHAIPVYPIRGHLIHGSGCDD